MGELSYIALHEMPSYTEQDTKWEGKRHYGQIAARFREEGCLNLQQLVCLIDTIHRMDPQIYEHYRSLQDLFRENIRRFLEDIRRPDGVYQVKTEAEQRQLIYCLKQACADKTLLQEKYQDLPIIKQEVAYEKERGVIQADF